MKTTKLIEMPVASLAEGTKVGYVSDVLFDVGALRTLGLVLQTGTGEGIVRTERIHAVGDDVVTIDSTGDVIGPLEETEERTTRGFNALKGTRIVNADGTVLGTVSDVEIALPDGRLTEIEGRRGGILGVGGADLAVVAENVRGIGPDFVTVDLPAQADSHGAEEPSRPTV